MHKRNVKKVHECEVLVTMTFQQSWAEPAAEDVSTLSCLELFTYQLVQYTISQLDNELVKLLASTLTILYHGNGAMMFFRRIVALGGLTAVTHTHECRYRHTEETLACDIPGLNSNMDSGVYHDSYCDV